MTEKANGWFKFFCAVLPFLIVFIVAFLSLGFGWPLTPGRQIAALHAQDSAEAMARFQADDTQSKRVDSLLFTMRRVTTLTEGLARARCRETPVLAVDVGLPCRELRGGR